MQQRILLLLFLLTCPATHAADFSWTEAEERNSTLSARRIAIISSLAEGVVTKVHLEMGQPFSKGDTLVEFDSRMAESNLVSAQAALDAAATAKDAVESMFNRNNASHLELANARRDHALAATRLAAAKLDLERTAIKAPWDGRVADVLVHEHEMIARGAKIIALVDDSTLRVDFLLPEEETPNIQIGQPVSVAIPAVGIDTNGKVSHIAAILDPVSRTFDVRAEIDNLDGKLRAGMTATVKLLQDAP